MRDDCVLPGVRVDVLVLVPESVGTRPIISEETIGVKNIINKSAFHIHAIISV